MIEFFLQFYYFDNLNNLLAYISTVLSKPPDQNSKLQQVRDYIYESFDYVDGFLLPHPGSKVTRHGYNGNHGDMEDNFRTHLINLIEELLKPENLVKKRILGEQVEGHEYGQYVKTYFEKFQSPDTPLISSIYEATVERQLSNYLAEAMKYYKDGLNKNTNFNQSRPDFEQSLDLIHDNAQKAVILWFNKMKKMGSKEHESKFREQLKTEIKTSYEAWRAAAMNTYNDMENQRVANAARIVAIEAENAAALAAEIAAQEKIKRETEAAHQAELARIAADATLSQQKKDAEIKRINEENKKQRIRDEAEMQRVLEANRVEAERVRIENEKKYEAKIAQIKAEQEKKQKIVEEQIEQQRKIFTEMIKKQNDDRIAERKMLEERWALEDEQRNKQLEAMKHLMTEEAKRHREQIARMEEARQKDRKEANARWMQEFEARKREIFERRQERAENSKMFAEQMRQIRELQAAQNRNHGRSKANSSAKPSVVFTVISSLTLIVFTFHIQRK
jgi:hypothetical protein